MDFHPRSRSTAGHCEGELGGDMRGGTLSIVVPVYNEERRLPALLEQLDTEADGTLASADLRLVEVIVVDDGSIDATASILEESDRLEDGFASFGSPRTEGRAPPYAPAHSRPSANACS